jgi:uncharacterized protein (DUF2147 family)
MIRSPRFASLVLLISAIALAAPASNTTGDWQSPIGSVVRIQPCGSGVCLVLVKLPSKSPETTDSKNPSASLRTRALCGLVIGTGFHQTDASHLSGGLLYDPKTGHTYRGKIAAVGDRLDLRGYIGIPAFGRSETWKRVPAVAACKA